MRTMTLKFTQKESVCLLLNVKVLSEILVCFSYFIE